MSEKFVTFLPLNQRIKIEEGLSILELALKNGIEIDHSCGGMGSCTTCRVIVEKPVDNLPPRTELEHEIATDRGFKANERLSCQVVPDSDWSVRVPSGRT
jgi:ferredoxin